MILTHNSNQPHSRKAWMVLRSGTPRAICFAILWWIITKGDISSWVIGIPVVLTATVASLVLIPIIRFRLSVTGTFRFFCFFLLQSFIGGLDVARRAIHPRLSLEPFLFNYSFCLPTGLSRVVMVNTISLLPGTLSAELYEDSVTVHVLDETKNLKLKLEILEEHVAYLFRQKLLQSEDSKEC